MKSFWIKYMTAGGTIGNHLVLPHESLCNEATDIVKDGGKIARVEDLSGKEHTRKVFNYLATHEQNYL